MEDNSKIINKVLNTASIQYNNVINCLNELTTNTHLMHLRRKSLGIHLALNDLYQSLPEILDRFVESFQGKYGIFESYTDFKTYSGEPISYLKSKIAYLEKNREGLKEGYLQQILDEGIEDIYVAIYKIENLL